MSEESSSVGNSKSINKDVIEAVNLVAHGKRNILCGEISQAVTQLQEACRILATEFGELADECADSYLWYGKALLELFRIEGGVLGDAIPGTAESDDSESSADESESDQNSTNADNNEGDDDELEEGVLSEDLEEEEAVESKEEFDSTKDDKGTNRTGTLPDVSVSSTHEGDDTANAIKDASNAATIANGNGAENKVSDCDETKENPSNSQENENSDAVAGSSKQDATDNDDISNLQLAWEMLELSKLIYQRHERDDMKLKLAETYLKLGEIGMETEQYDQAITDLSHCLSIQQRILRPEDRRLAETLYQMGLACTYCRKYDTAIAHYRSAMAVIQAKIGHLGRVVAGEINPDPTENGDGFYTPLELAKREIEELQALLPDISSKIDDVLDEQGEADKVKMLMQETVAPSTSAFGNRLCDGASSSGFKPVTTTPEQPVNNISHLVRKKRKSDDDSTQSSDPQKKQKTSENLMTKSGFVESSRQIATSDNSEMAATMPATACEETASTATFSSQEESRQTEKVDV